MTTFPYRQNSKGDFFPIIDLYIIYRKNLERTYALVDSGATISIFTQDIAQKLNLTINKGREIFLGGVGGRIKGYLHNLELEIGNKKFITPVVFSYEYTVSLNLLGRKGIFENFRIIFEEKRLSLRLE